MCANIAMCIFFVMCYTRSVDSSLYAADVNLVRIGGLNIVPFLILLPLKQTPSILLSPAIFIPFNHLYSLQLVRLEWKQLVTVSSVS